MLSVVTDPSRIDQHSTTVTLSGTIEELISPEATRLAIQTAAQAGMTRPGISNLGGTYPVDEEGKSDEKLILGQRPGIVGYRRDFELKSALG